VPKPQRRASRAEINQSCRDTSSQEDSNSTEETKSPIVEEDTKLKKPESKPNHGERAYQQPFKLKAASA